MGFFKDYPFGVACKLTFSEQLLSRISFIIPDKHFLINYWGGKIHLNLKEYNPGRNKALGVYEYWKTRLFMNLVKPGMIVVDIGVR